MRAFSLGLMVLGFALAPAWAALPSLTVVGEGRDPERLELRELSMSVEVVGDVAETVLELEFFNHTSRQQEGEFLLQLPEGATVSSYALEVQGAMRPGVSVEKERARLAYETIKRQRKDPGLVERQAGNVYRTRIFPIAANSPKRVRIGYLESIRNGRYQFSFDHDKPLASFRCQVSGGDGAGLSVKGVKREATEDGGTVTWTGRDLSPKGTLELAPSPLVPGELARWIQREPDGTRYLFAQGRMAESGKPTELPRPKRVRIIWDASDSGRTRDREREIEALERYLAWVGDAEVELFALRTRLEPLLKHSMKQGSAGPLVKAVRDIAFDGAADFSRIGEQDGAVTLLFTDGKLSSPAWNLSDGIPGKRFFVVNSMAPPLAFEERVRGGTTVDLRAKDWFDRLTLDKVGVEVRGAAGETVRIEREGERFTITSKLSVDGARPWEVVTSGGDSWKIDPRQEAADVEKWGLVRRIWAQRRLRELERSGSRGEITEFAMAERLVSDYTSVIVLERFGDHLRYRIPPPEPDQLERYERETREGLTLAKQRLESEWDRKLRWYRTPYPWIDIELANAVPRVAIWVKASREAFPEDKLNREALEPYEQWLPGAREVLEKKESLDGEEVFTAWRESVGRAVERLREIQKTNAARKQSGRIHVSVRGFVNQRGIYSADSPFLLEDAIEQAGGPNPLWGDWARVYLYRDAARTGYNLRASDYQAVPLRWGDMIVVESGPNNHHPTFLSGGPVDGFSGPIDPFAAPASGGARRGGGSAAAGPGVFEEAGSFQPSASSATSGGSDAFIDTSQRPGDENFVIRFVEREPEELATGIDQAIVDSLRKSEQPAREYREWASHREDLPSAATMVEVARVLFEKGERELGERALSNWLEWLPNSFEAVRAFSLWMAELGEEKRATTLLVGLAESVGDPASRAVVRHDLARLSGDAADFRAVIERLLETEEPGAFGSIVLTDYFAAGGRAEEALRSLPPNPLASDVRIVVTSSGDDVAIAVREPGAESPDWLGLSAHGGRPTNASRVHEYQMKNGLPGEYQLVCRRIRAGRRMRAPVTLRVTWYSRWAGEGQAVRTATYLMEGDEMKLGGLDFSWAK